MPRVLEDDTSSVKDTSSVTSRFPTLAQRPSEAGKTGVCVSRRGEERGAQECRPAPGRAAPPASRPVLAPHPAAPRPAAPRPAIPVRGIMWAVSHARLLDLMPPSSRSLRARLSAWEIITNAVRKKEKMETGKNKSEFQYLLPAVTVKSPRSRCQEKVPRTLEG